MKRWPTKMLGEVLDLSRERIEPIEHPKTSFNYIGLESIEGHTGNLLPYQHTPGVKIKSTKNVFHPGEILYGKLRPYLNKVHLAVTDGICSTDIYVLRTRQQELNPSFAANYLRSPSVLSVVSSAMAGANLPRIGADALFRIPIPVPPLAEQERIVKLLEDADEQRKLRSQADLRTAEYIPALFHEMFGDTSCPLNGSVVLSVGEIIKSGSLLSIQDGNHGEIHPKAAEYLTEGVSFIFANHIAKNELDLSTCPFLSVQRAKKLRVGFAKPNDVLLSHKGSIGFTAVVPTELEFAVLSPQVTYYRFDTTKIDPFYAWAYFQTASFQSTFERLSRQATRAYVGITRQKELPFLVAPLPLQKEFAERASEIRDLKASQSTSRAHLDALFQSMLHGAFTGEM